MPTTVEQLLAQSLQSSNPYLRDCARNSYKVIGNGVALFDVAGGIFQPESTTPHTQSWFSPVANLIGGVVAMIEDPTVKCVALVLNCPGGSSSSTAALAEAFGMLRAKKPVMAYVHQATSQGNLVASFANKIVVSEVGMMGALGTVWGLIDYSGQMAKEGLKGIDLTTRGLKNPGGFGTPITPQQIAHDQKIAFDYESVYIGHIAANLGVTPESLKALDGAIFIGQNAVKAGLAHSVMDFGDFLAMCDQVASTPTQSQSGGKPANATQVPSKEKPMSKSSAANNKQPAKPNKPGNSTDAGTDAGTEEETTTTGTDAANSEGEGEEGMTEEQLREKYPEAVAAIEAKAKASSSNALPPKPAANAVPATLEQLNELTKKDKDASAKNQFIIDQLTNKASFDQAKDAYIAKLQEMASNSAAPSGAGNAAGKPDAGKMTDVIPTGKPAGNAAPGTYEAEVKKHAAENKVSIAVASAKVAEEKPDLHKAWRERGYPSIA